MFAIDERLATTSILLIEWPLCQVRLKNNALFPWFLLIPQIPALSELHELSKGKNGQLMQEIHHLSALIKKQYQADKINIGLLGNIVPQMHVHVIARFKNDAAWPHSLWQDNIPESAYTAPAIETIFQSLVPLLLEESKILAN